MSGKSVTCVPRFHAGSAQELQALTAISKLGCLHTRVFVIESSAIRVEVFVHISFPCLVASKVSCDRGNTGVIDLRVRRRQVTLGNDSALYEFRAFMSVAEDSPIRFVVDGRQETRGEVWEISVPNPIGRGGNGRMASSARIECVSLRANEASDVNFEFSIVRKDFSLIRASSGGASYFRSEAQSIWGKFQVNSGDVLSNAVVGNANGKGWQLFSASRFRENEEINLKKYECMTGYVRTDVGMLGKISRIYSRMADLLKQGSGQEAFVIWGPSGWGKTFIPECVISELSVPYKCIEKVSGKTDRLISEISRCAETEQNGLFVLDEADCTPTDSLIFEQLLFQMDELKKRARGASIFVFVGSTLAGIDKFKERIGQRERGTDVMRRVGIDNSVEISEMNPEEKVVCFVAMLFELVRGKVHELDDLQIERPIIWYLLQADYDNARAIKELATKTLQRLSSLGRHTFVSAQSVCISSDIERFMRHAHTIRPEVSDTWVCFRRH